MVGVKVGENYTFMDVAKQLVAGGIAGSCAKTSVAPLERVKILFQVSTLFSNFGFFQKIN